MWYFFIADCGREMHSKYLDMPNLVVEMEFYNDWQHLSQEDFWILPINICMFFVFLYALGFSFFSYLKQFKKDEIAESPLVLVSFTLLIEISQIFLDTIHMYSLKEYGEGILIFDIFNNVLHICSQFLVICIFLLLACGWTITYTNILEREHYIFIGGFGLAINAITGFLTYLDNGEAH